MLDTDSRDQTLFMLATDNRDQSLSKLIQTAEIRVCLCEIQTAETKVCSLSINREEITLDYSATVYTFDMWTDSRNGIHIGSPVWAYKLIHARVDNRGR